MTSTASVTAQSGLELTSGEYAKIAIADTGRGMPPCIAAHAFELFFTTRERGTGTGLGLSQVYGFAKQSGGTATIDSAVGRGTTVTSICRWSRWRPLAKQSRRQWHANPLQVLDGPSGERSTLQLSFIGYFLFDGHGGPSFMPDGEQSPRCVCDLRAPERDGCCGLPIDMIPYWAAWKLGIVGKST